MGGARGGGEPAECACRAGYTEEVLSALRRVIQEVHEFAAVVRCAENHASLVEHLLEFAPPIDSYGPGRSEDDGSARAAPVYVGLDALPEIAREVLSRGSDEDELRV